MSNLILIGMPGSGKSTFGRKLAGARHLDFIDTDDLIESHFGCRLQAVVDEKGVDFMREFEAQTICQVGANASVIATGGSVVYSDRAMQHLSTLGQIIYLRISLSTFLRRVSGALERGLFKPPSMTLPELYQERKNLYEQWADLKLENNLPLTDHQFDVLNAQIGLE